MRYTAGLREVLIAALVEDARTVLEDTSPAYIFEMWHALYTLPLGTELNESLGLADMSDEPWSEDLHTDEQLPIVNMPWYDAERVNLQLAYFMDNANLDDVQLLLNVIS